MASRLGGGSVAAHTAGRTQILFARTINAVPSPSMPVLLVVLVGLGALLFANLVAILPGRAAGRAPTAPVLRSE